MRVRALRSLSLFAVGPLIAVAGCGGQRGPGDDGTAPARRARQVAKAWDGSAAAAAWRAGYHPTGEVVRLPRGGLRSQDDKRAFLDHDFVLRGTLPEGGPKDGRVSWGGGATLTRPVVGAAESYRSLAVGRDGRKPHLTVTGAELGGMTVATSRGAAVVPAWLFTLKGYDSPLEVAAVTASPLPPSPIGLSDGAPGLRLDRLVRIAADGRSVTVLALDGVCDDGPVVGALETRGSVVLWASVRNRKRGQDCTKQARLEQVTVKLRRPLGDRVLLDACTGRPLPYRGTGGRPR
ncbi:MULTISPECIES: hypothetical protein [Streptomyces]|uniref:hypothetical protein n=1 Tax=Streptomyces TaxID=1883 RepID=UPI001926CE83|nr:hypothetical protein [Streptomyces sp. SID685]